jgi:hypothetical protein
MQRKEDDHSHSNGVNQFFHLLSSSVYLLLYSGVFEPHYGNVFGIGCAVRQFGRDLEPHVMTREKLFGYHAQQDAHHRIFIDTSYTAVAKQRLDCIGSDFHDRHDRSTVVSLDHGRGLRASGVSHVEA